ncbi:phasin family protein [Halomonas sp. TRM85114]|uniref:phasin family protein n=1 Tax=Halomonas jincaotanensis TaxID=2810616 RepID=UPI001BD4FBFD|nr:phasin family protein [Halomonas jincaotanensis]MBS9402738.1 phasin family protein [Halomonas jincaotanensis]
MSQATTPNIDESFERLVAPCRSYADLMLEYCQKLSAAQNDAIRAGTDLGMAQARTWLEARDAETFKLVVESQQKTTEDISERFKGDADRIMALSREYILKGQKLVEKNVLSLPTRPV